MADLVIRGGKIIDPKNHFWHRRYFFIEDGKVIEISNFSSTSTKQEELNAEGKIVIPGIIDMHTHMRTLFGHPHAQRMVALAGVCTAF